MAFVALLAEGVDRNPNLLRSQHDVLEVALLAEGVDRNFDDLRTEIKRQGSPSSRRAWIEILRIHYFVSGKPSPSSRRAWIEIDLKADVSASAPRRPPRGGRG